jgi:hypothetical protein
MIRCFLTGIEMRLEDSYVLDISEARHALRDLRQQVITLERLVEQLGEYDHVEVQDKKGKRRVRKDRRLVSESMAKALSAACPAKRIFLPWREWCAQRPFKIGRPAVARAQSQGVAAQSAEDEVVSASLVSDSR